ncbi:MAG: sel1 repeat family protein [Roseomonas sp.]|nr:sel1 repeat family protein [Roseomonas sp.]
MGAAALLGATPLVQQSAAQPAPGVAPGITDCDRLAQPLRSAVGRAALVDGVAPTAIDVPRARAACEAAIAAHPQEPRFQAWLGRVFSAGGLHAEAAAAYRRAAEQGNPVAQSKLGLMLQNGQGVARDDAQAVQWYRRAADQGLAIAQNNLGYALATGRGVARDDAQAAQWYWRAAEQGMSVVKSFETTW